MTIRRLTGLALAAVLLALSGRAAAPETSARPVNALVLLGEWFGDTYFPLKNEIESRGWAMKRVGPDAEYRGCYKKKRDVLLTSDILIQDLKDFTGFDCLIIPSGPQFRKFNENPAVLQFVRDARSAGLLIASFCTGNLVVKAAGLVDLPEGPGLFPSSVTLVKAGILLGPRGGGPPPGDGFKAAPVKEICDAIARELAGAVKEDSASSPPEPPAPDTALRQLHFANPPAADSDTARTLQSLVKVQGTGGLQQDALYLLTQYGAREELFQKENQRALDEPMIRQTWRFCSIFAAPSGEGRLMGRNFDNQNVGSIIVNCNRPPSGYASVTFCRAMDLGFPLNLDLEQIKGSEFGQRLLLAPFYATDGVNEHGLAMATAGSKPALLHAPPELPRIFVTRLVGLVLHQARNVDEAVNLVRKYVPFDLDGTMVNTHFLVADAAGRSVVLEYDGSQWQVIPAPAGWQALTNKAVHQVPAEKLKEQCRRYRALSGKLEPAKPLAGWRDGMQLLRDVSQKGTSWSVVYSLTKKELFFTVYQQWSVVYRLAFP